VKVLTIGSVPSLTTRKNMVPGAGAGAMVLFTESVALLRSTVPLTTIWS
jgi:hypothetical protein